MTNMIHLLYTITIKFPHPLSVLPACQKNIPSSTHPSILYAPPPLHYCQTRQKHFLLTIESKI